MLYRGTAGRSSSKSGGKGKSRSLFSAKKKEVKVKDLFSKEPSRPKDGKKTNDYFGGGSTMVEAPEPEEEEDTFDDKLFSGVDDEEESAE